MSEEIAQENILLALDEMRAALTAQHSAGDMLDQKAGNLINAAGFILAVVPSLQLVFSKGAPSPVFWIGLALAFVIYLLMVCAIIFVILPSHYSTPLKADWEIAGQLLVMPPGDASQSILLGYIKSIKLAFDTNGAKVFWLRVGYAALGLVVTLMTIATVAMASAK